MLNRAPRHPNSLCAERGIAGEEHEVWIEAATAVSGEDVARVAAGVLANPALPVGSAYPVVAEVLRLGEIIATLRRVLERDVRYIEISDQLWLQGALARGLNAHAAEHLSQLWTTLRTRPTRVEVTDSIETLGGRKPKSFEEFVREERATFVARAA